MRAEVIIVIPDAGGNVQPSLRIGHTLTDHGVINWRLEPRRRLSEVSMV